MILTSLIAISKGELLDNYKGRKGKFIKNFLLNDQRNKNGWRVTWESILENAADFINHPGVYFERFGDPDHPDGTTYKDNMSNQEKYRVVNIVDVMVDEKTKTLNYVGEIIDDEFAKLYESGKINMTSPGIWPLEYKVVGEMPNGRPMLDVYKWRALHSAYINDPAFGDVAKTVGTCDGDGHTCKIALGGKSVASTDLAPLQQIPLIRRTLNNNYTPCKIKEFIGQLIKAKNDVGNKLREIIELNPNEPPDWQLAAAYAYNQDNAIKALISSTEEYFIPREVELGIRLEMQHTDNPKIAEEVAKDNLRTSPNYYSKLLHYVDPGAFKDDLIRIMSPPLQMTAKEVIDAHVLVEKGFMSHQKYDEMVQSKLGFKTFDNPTTSITGNIIREKTDTEIALENETIQLNKQLIAKTEAQLQVIEKQEKALDKVIEKLEEL